MNPDLMLDGLFDNKEAMVARLRCQWCGQEDTDITFRDAAVFGHVDDIPAAFSNEHTCPNEDCGVPMVILGPGDCADLDDDFGMSLVTD